MLFVCRCCARLFFWKNKFCVCFRGLPHVIAWFVSIARLQCCLVHSHFALCLFPIDMCSDTDIDLWAEHKLEQSDEQKRSDMEKLRKYEIERMKCVFGHGFLLVTVVFSLEGISMLSSRATQRKRVRGYAHSPHPQTNTRTHT